MRICHDKACHIKTYFVKPSTARGVQFKSQKIPQDPVGVFFIEVCLYEFLYLRKWWEYGEDILKIHYFLCPFEIS